VSEENVQIVHRVYDALRRRDVEAFLREMHPDVEGMSWVMEADGDVFRGHDGMRRFLGEIWAVFPDWSVEVVEVIAHEDKALAELDLGGRGAGSGAPVHDTRWQVATFRDGRVIAWRGFAAREEALAAAGLTG
jgi:ketosteroid isomerase-like protein